MQNDKTSEHRGQGFVRRHWPLIRHWLTFMIILGLFVAISEYYSDLTNRRFSEVTATWMTWSMKLLGVNAGAIGIHFTCSVCRFTIIGECTAYYPCAIFVSAVLAFPSPWPRRLLGVLLGVPVVLLINQVRLVSLCYIHRSFPDLFETLHIVVWQSLIVFLTVLLWIVWVVTLGSRR